MTLKTRLAAAALAAALSTPALAADPACSVCDDPTWPELAAPAPAIVVFGPDERPAFLDDPTWPALAQAAPALPTVAHAAEGPIYEPSIGMEPAVHYAVVAATPATTVARATYP